MRQQKPNIVFDPARGHCAQADDLRDRNALSQKWEAWVLPPIAGDFKILRGV
jgi:hypothetical protein